MKPNKINQKVRAAQRELHGAIGPGIDEYVDDEEEDDSPEPNYKCVVCDTEVNISEHKRRAPAWCNDCGGIKCHERIPQKS